MDHSFFFSVVGLAHDSSCEEKYLSMLEDMMLGETDLPVTQQLNKFKQNRCWRVIVILTFQFLSKLSLLEVSQMRFFHHHCKCVQHNYTNNKDWALMNIGIVQMTPIHWPLSSCSVSLLKVTFGVENIPPLATGLLAITMNSQRMWEKYSWGRSSDLLPPSKSYHEAENRCLSMWCNYGNR